MMDFHIKDSKNYIGQDITIRGWVFSVRSSGSIVFLQIRDGSGFIQVVVSKKDVAPEAFAAAVNLTDESSVIVKGVVKEEPRSPYGYEINASDLKIVHLSQPFPIAKKMHGVDFLLSLRHLWLRSRKQWAILRVRNQIINAINEFLQNDGYIKIDAPIITPSACEGTTTLFAIDYFGKNAYLSQSGQLYLEAAIASFGKVYDFGPTFRAEKSKTKRHLTEFWMMDAEEAFMEYDRLLELEEKLIHFVIQNVLANCQQEFQILGRDLAPLAKIKMPSQPFPIAKKMHGVDFLLSLRHLWLRSRKQWAILRVRNQIINAINEFLQNDGYIKIDAPIITPSACEGTTTLFAIDYFGKNAYLSQSGQLYLEAAIASFGKVYDFGPTFRAEKSKTKRHLTEFWMMDAEEAFMEYDRLLELEEKLIHFVIQNVLANCQQEFQILGRDLAPLAKIKMPFLRLTYQETLTKLRELGSDIKDGEDLGNDDETMLMNHFDQPLFIMKFPAAFKAFYFKRDAGDPEATLSADLLAPEGYGEITGGGQREDDYQTLLKRMKDLGINEKDYDWYLDLRKYGSVPHAGFGIGLERLVAWLCHLDHIRKAIPFPRTIYRFSP